MAKNSRVPPPPVQAPKRRDGGRPAGSRLAALPKWAWLVATLVLAGAIVVVVYAATSGGGTPLPLAPAAAAGTLAPAPPSGPVGPEGVPIPRQGHSPPPAT